MLIELPVSTPTLVTRKVCEALVTAAEISILWITLLRMGTVVCLPAWLANLVLQTASVMDRQTDRHYHSICRASLRRAFKRRTIIWQSDDIIDVSDRKYIGCHVNHLCGKFQQYYCDLNIPILAFRCRSPSWIWSAVNCNNSTSSGDPSWVTVRNLLHNNLRDPVIVTGRNSFRHATKTFCF